MLNLFFGWGQTASEVTNLGGNRCAVQADSMAEKHVPQEGILCIFENGRLVDHHSEGTVPSQRSGEQWWLIAEGEKELSIQLDLGGKLLETRLSVRFEPESELWELLSGRECLIHDEVASLLTSHLTGLLDMFGYQDADLLLNLAEADRERLRAKLSLLLQNKGMRCTDFGAFELVGPADEGEPTIPETPDEPASQEETVPSEDLSQTDLSQIAEEVETFEDWETLLGSLEEAGCRFDEGQAAELEELGDALLGQQQTAGEAASRLKHMAEEARRRAGIPDPETRRFRGLDMRLPTSGAMAPQEGEPSESSAPNSEEGSHRRRPRTWWMLRRRSVDRRLRRFLSQVLGDLKSSLDTYRRQQSPGDALVQLRKLDGQLDLIQDLLETVPTLSPPYRKLRPSRAEIQELVQSVERAVTAAETAQGELRGLQQQTPQSEAWQESYRSLTEALQQLTRSLNQRRTLH